MNGAIVSGREKIEINARDEVSVIGPQINDVATIFDARISPLIFMPVNFTRYLAINGISSFPVSAGCRINLLFCKQIVGRLGSKRGDNIFHNRVCWLRR